MKKGIIFLAIVMVPALGYYFYNFHRYSTNIELPTIKVIRGDLKVVLNQLGEVKAVKSTNIASNTWGKLAEIVPEGAVVEKDQPIAWMETEELEQELERRRVDLVINKTRLEKAIEEQRLDAEMNRLAVQEAEANLRYQQTKLENAQSELAKVKRLVEANLIRRKSLEDAELKVLSEELQLKNAEIALEKAKDNFKSQLELKKADVNNARIDVEKAQTEYDNEQDKLDKAIIKAPTSGIVMYKKKWKGGSFEKIQAGDQVGPWDSILEIPDLSDMEIITLVDEIDISNLELNMTATIKLDAFPEMELTGVITQISTLAREVGQDVGWGREKKTTGRKVFEVFININEALPELRPGVTGQVEILLDELEDVLYIPIECLHKSGDEEYVYVSRYGTPQKVIVETGKSNYHHVVIENGLSEGQVVYLGDPFEEEES